MQNFSIENDVDSDSALKKSTIIVEGMKIYFDIFTNEEIVSDGYKCK